MLRDNEMRTIGEMQELMVKVLHENGINPLQAMSLVGYAARQVITDIGRSIKLSADMAVIMNLGAMLPEDYLRELSGQQSLPSNGCGCAK